jgi:uncharacterized membrane protein
MTILIVGLIVFLGMHSLSFLAPGLRQSLQVRIGEAPYKGLAGAVGLVGFLLIIWGYGAARMDLLLLYAPPVWTRHLALLILLPVFPLLFAAYLPGRIQSWAKHPMLLAVIFWAAGHLIANGTLVDVVLFGSFLAWALADRISLTRRTEPPVQGAPPGKANDWIALVGGLLLYGAFLGGVHSWLIGVSPLGVR